MARRASIAPSILSADFSNLAREISRVTEGGADLLHLDVMDGHFVPNITIGPPVIASIRKQTRLTLDVHLMIEEPARYLDEFLEAGADWISVHQEADRHLDRTIHYIRERGAVAGVAINPATPLGALQEILPEVDFVLVMSVNPGYGGQQFVPSSLQKIRNLREIIASNGYHARVEVDGGIGPENLSDVLGAGADIVVMGSAVFSAGTDPAKAVRGLKDIAEQHCRLLETT